MVVGTGTLVGTRGTLGTDPHTLCFLWYTPRGIRSNALGHMPVMVNLLDRMVDVVERLDLVRQVLARYRIGPRKVAVCPPPYPALDGGSRPPQQATQTPLSGRTLPVPGNPGRAGTPTQTGWTHSGLAALAPLAHALHRATLVTQGNTGKPTHHGRSTQRCTKTQTNTRT